MLVCAETILPMFLLWSHLCDRLQSYELLESFSSPFWVKPEWTGKVSVSRGKEATAPEEVEPVQRVDRSIESYSYVPRPQATGKVSSYLDVK